VNKRVTNIGIALMGGAVVFVAGVAVNLALLPHDRTSIVHQLIANCITGLITVVIALSIQLRYEERHYRFAAERAAHMAEVNHNVRNAVFPLCWRYNVRESQNRTGWPRKPWRGSTSRFVTPPWMPIAERLSTRKNHLAGR
jgi:hypothetical protein